MSFRKGSLRRLAAQAGGLSSVVLLWAALVGFGLVSPQLLPGPIEVARYFGSAAWWLSVLYPTWLTLQSALVAIVCSTVLGVTVGLAIGSFDAIYRGFRVPIEFLRAVPPIALIPVTVLSFGQTSTSARLLAIFGAVWPILIQTIYGVRAVDPNLKDVAKAYGISPVGVLFHITIPSAMPYIMTGFVLSSAIALIAIIAAELIVGIPGLGADINMARAGGVADLAYALTIWTGVIGLCMAKLAASISGHTLRWQPRNARSVA